jgi:hypothetical protein
LFADHVQSEDPPLPRLPFFYGIDFDNDLDLIAPSRQPRPRRRERAEAAPRFRPTQRRNESEPFKCGRCRAFIDPPASGSRYRNHCPLCLTSRHVDAKRPGDRACPCRGLMPAVGTYFRPDGEQMLVHRCNGCGAERTNRIAADDNPVVLRRLAPVAPPRFRELAAEDEAIA